MGLFIDPVSGRSCIMVLSEAEAEARLSDLRRQRDTIDRAITDLTLYLELGRRLTGTTSGPTMRSNSMPLAAVSEGMMSEETRPETSASTFARELRPATGSADARQAFSVAPSPPAAPETKSGPVFSAPADTSSTSDEPSPSVVPEGALARRYGRALIQAAVAVLEEAGRPLHVSEILSRLIARGYSVPGQHDPVAALNTRLWKRSGEGGPVRRLGDAVYTLPDSSQVAS